MVLNALLVVMLPTAALPPVTPFSCNLPMVEVVLFTPTVKPFQFSLLRLDQLKLEVEFTNRIVPCGSPLVPSNLYCWVALS